MSDVKNEIKLAILELLQEMVAPKATAGATGFGPLPGDDRVQIQGGDGQQFAWYRLDAGNGRHYIEEEAFTGTVVSVNTRDQSGDRGSTRKIDLIMRSASGDAVTFVLGLRTKLTQPETTVGSKSLLAALASCADNERVITIAPKLGSDNPAVVLMKVLIDGASTPSDWPTEEESAANLSRAMQIFGGTHTPLKGQEHTQVQSQPPRSAAAPVKAAVAPVKSGWAELKFYLGDDDAAVAETREMIVTWCKDRYGLPSPTKIPASDQAAALDECKKYLDEQSVAVEVVVSEEDFDEIPF